MTSYEQGFMQKCAEYGLNERAAGALFKLAGWGSWGSQNRLLRQMHEDYLRKAYAGGYDQYVDRRYRGNSMPGTAWGRFWKRMFHGRHALEEAYRGDIEQAMDEARARWQQAYNQASPEERKYMLEERKQRQLQYQEAEKARLAGKYELANQSFQNQEAEKAKQTAGAGTGAATQNGQPQRVPTDAEITSDYRLRNNMKMYNYAHTTLDPQTGYWRSTREGVSLPPELVQQNMELDKAVRDYRNKPQQPAAPKPAEPKKPAAIGQMPEKFTTWH